MPESVSVSRKSLRRDQVLEIHFAPWPDPPPGVLNIPGAREWWSQMKLIRERDTQSFHRLVNNLAVADRIS